MHAHSVEHEVEGVNQTGVIAWVGISEHGTHWRDELEFGEDLLATDVAGMEDELDAGEGAVIHGENGWMLVTNTSWKAFDPDGKVMKEARGDTGDRAHVRNFLDAVRSRKRETLNQEIYSGHVSTLMCHAGNIAWRTGAVLSPNPRSGQLAAPADAAKLWSREYRPGWEPKV